MNMVPQYCPYGSKGVPLVDATLEIPKTQKYSLQEINKRLG